VRVWFDDGERSARQMFGFSIQHLFCCSRSSSPTGRRTSGRAVNATPERPSGRRPAAIRRRSRNVALLIALLPSWLIYL
jgi:hypothetical protein